MVGYFSKKLKPAEVRYSAIDREALAIVLACRQFIHYLWGTKFIIRTDHQPITTVCRQRTKSPRMNRWMLEMRDYRLKVEYKQGKNNIVADQLSRPVRVIQGSEDGTWLGKSRDEIQEMQGEEPRWREMINYLESGRISRSKYPRATLDQFSLEDGILYLCKQKIDGTILYLLVVPNELRKEALRRIHEKESGHLWQHKSILKAEDFFYWPNLRKDMKAFVKNCVTCQQHKTSSGLQQQWQELPPVDQPMERVSIDITEMGIGAIGQKYVLTVIDYFSRFVNLYLMSARTAESVVSKLNMVVEAYGAPRVLLVDNAREFCSERLTTRFRETRVRLVHSTPYHPQGNSISERMRRTMKAVLTTVCKGQPAVWPRYIKKCQKVLNSAVHEATGEQPHFLMFNRRIPRLIGIELAQLRQHADLEVVLKVVRRTNIDQARKWRSRANIGRKNQRVEVDQMVWVKKDYTTSLDDRKLGVKWVGPYKVKEVLRNGGAYRLENVFDGVRIQRAADKVKPYVGQGDILVQPIELIFRGDSDEADEVEPRPVRESRPPRRYGEEI